MVVAGRSARRPGQAELTSRRRRTADAAMVTAWRCRGAGSQGGHPPEDQPHVFDRWWHSTQAAQTRGSGIGLAVAAELARAHHGSIESASDPGEGSRFTLILPLATAGL
jgi:signal transduction histidine kinase